MESEKRCSFKAMAKDAKRRMKSGYWSEFDRMVEAKKREAEKEGANPSRIADFYIRKTIREVSGKKCDDEDFYVKVCEILLEEGEISDAIGRLIDHDVYDKLSYEQKQRYTLDLSNKYIVALERFRKEKEFGYFGSLAKNL